MKKIFIFKPSENWHYCGGGRAVIADSFEEAVSYFPDERMGVTEEELKSLSEAAKFKGWMDREEVPSWDNWVLVATYGLEGDPPKGIVLDDQNWG